MNFVSGSRYLGAYLGPQEQLEAWVKPQVEAWAHGVKVLAKIAQRHPWLAYAGLGMSLESEWAVPAKDCPRSGNSDGYY